jgi:hypothetical protein
MRNARRATTAFQDGADGPRTRGASTLTSARYSPESRPLKSKSAPIKNQAKGSHPSRRSRQRATFTAIIQSVRWSNIARLKNRGFSGNRLAKLVTGHSRSLCYQVKDAAINALVKHGAASLLSLAASDHGATLGIAFLGGGKLHIKPSCLDAKTQGALREQLLTALSSQADQRSERGANQ